MMVGSFKQHRVTREVKTMSPLRHGFNPCDLGKSHSVLACLKCLSQSCLSERAHLQFRDFSEHQYPVKNNNTWISIV